jgi:hypothetical protein
MLDDNTIDAIQTLVGSCPDAWSAFMEYTANEKQRAVESANFAPDLATTKRYLGNWEIWDKVSKLKEAAYK